MSSYDSGIVIIAAPVLITVGAVSLAGAAISAAAEKYRRYRLSEAEEIELQRKLELDCAARMADENREEYYAELNRRITEETTRREKEENAQDAARSKLREEARAAENLKREIREKVTRMENDIMSFEMEFGENAELRRMADTIHHSEKMFGDGAQLIRELNDMIFIILPGMTGEKRRERHAEQVSEQLGKVVSSKRVIVDSSEDFVSLHTGGQENKIDADRSPWEKFMARIQFVASVEEAYYESEAAQLLEEAEDVAPARRNFFIQQHSLELTDMEEKAFEYQNKQKALTDEVIDDFCMYLAMADKLGIEPRFTEDDIHNAYTLAAMREEMDVMTEQYKKVRERQYTVNAFTTVMKRHNLLFENMTVGEDGQTDIEYSMDSQTGVRISHSEAGAFEMQFQGKSRGISVSADERRTVTEKANHFCSMLPEITKELEEEFGITFDQTNLQPPSAESIEFHTAESGARRERARTAKVMQMK